MCCSAVVSGVLALEGYELDGFFGAALHCSRADCAPRFNGVLGENSFTRHYVGSRMCFASLAGALVPATSHQPPCVQTPQVQAPRRTTDFW
mmetsp:Transcript_17490/g.38535  ORF Transcript_17490/g.38535 Transcript_17490/m.38535 type:complete len:91 (+) Transcript_17490:260-532(+)